MESKPSIAIVGPLPPPAGGMARQTIQQIELLKLNSYQVSVVQTNMPYTFKWVEQIKGLRAAVRLVHYFYLLLTTLRKVDVVHIMANSGWSWHLFATPAILVSKLYGNNVIVNYRGGEAEQFFKHSWAKVKPFMLMADQVVVPSDFLHHVFKNYGVESLVIPNTLNRELFKPVNEADSADTNTTHIVVTRNLEKIYDVEMAIKSFHEVFKAHPNVRLSVAGSGPEESTLKQLVKTLSLSGVVTFCGRLEQNQIAELYQNADILLNTSVIDNSPNALIEALSTGVAIVSSAVGGIPFLVTDNQNALLVFDHKPSAYADKISELIENPDKKAKLITNGLKSAERFDRNSVVERWCEQYMINYTNKPTISLITKLMNLLTRLYTPLAAKLLFPVHERLKKHSTVQARQKMEAVQWWSADALNAYQQSELTRFVERIYNNVPYYKTLFDKLGLKPGDVTTVSDLQKLPFLTKPVIRENTEQLKTTTAHTLSRFNTGGSSGQPLIFYIGKERVSHDVAAKWRATRWWNVDIGDPEIVLWGSPIELGKQDRIKLVRDFFLRTELISAFNLNEQTKQQILKKIQTTRPKMLFGYPSVYFLLANYAEEQGIDMTQCGVKAIFVTSERLYDHQREKIQQVFNAPVANGYGGRDAGFIAHECPHGNMHITADDIVVEIVSPEGKTLPVGQSGEIVVTHLRTSEFPFVRYKTGDIGILSDKQCSCGISLPILEKVEGRTTDFIVAADGTQMHGLALIYHVRDVKGVKNFKIEQESLDKTNLYLEIEKQFDESSFDEIKSNFKKRLGEGVEINIEVVDTIPAEKSGKFRYVVSRVSP